MYDFKVGDNAVYLSHGVGVVKGIEEREVSPGNKKVFYILEIRGKGAAKKVFVPTDNPHKRLRPIIKKKEVAVSEQNYEYAAEVRSQELEILKDTHIPLESFAPYKSLAFFAGYVKDEFSMKKINILTYT